jgi:hypothetical protein
MYQIYIEATKLNLHLRPEEWFFKSDSNYTYMLEHVSYEQGLKYIECIKSEFQDIYDKYSQFFVKLCNKNDLYGRPKQFDFPNFCYCSPSCLRYIYHSLLNLKHMQDLHLDNVNVIEIGGGYGGLCFFIKSLSSLFNIKIKTYTIFDIKEACKLQSLYLNALEINEIQCVTLDDKYLIFTNSYLISNYAFSEIDHNFQNEYIEKVISSKVSNGMMVWNHIQPYKFIDKDFNIEVERPLTSTIGLNTENKFIYF